MVRNVFTHQSAAMARIPLRPAVPTPDEDSTGLLTEGIFLASRAAAQAGEGPRIAATHRAYTIRSRARTTPHGVFAGVATATFTAQGAVPRLGADHCAVTVPSPAWLAAIADQLLDTPGVLPHLTVTANNLVVRRGDRLEAEHPAPEAGAAQQSSVRATDVALWLLDTCRNGAPASAVLTGLVARYPEAGEEAVSGAIRQMIRAGLLLTNLLPADLRDDPLEHLARRLPPSASPRPSLLRLRDLLRRADTHRPGTAVRLELLQAARQAADELAEVERSLTVDTLADATVTLPNAIGEQAAQAASILWQVSQLTSPATGYHEKFVRAYGHHRMVPLLDAIDPAAGIGPPADTDSIGAESDIDPRRAALLARLLADATTQGQAEVRVDDELAARLTHDSRAAPPRTAEIHVRLLRHGDKLCIAVCPDAGSQDAGSAAGRFARWLPDLAPDTADPTGVGPMVAEIVCRPRTGSTGALAVETGFAPYRIPLGVPECDGDLTLDDLLVTTTRGHLSVWSARHQRPVLPVLFSRLAPDLLPPAARALVLIGHVGTRPWHTWSWGPAGYAPHTPRVRYRNILLAPARWRLPEELAQTAAHRQQWDTALSVWHTDAVPAPPDVVVVQEVDRQIPLDLRQDEDRELLRRSVQRGANSITEPLGSPDAHSTAMHGPDGAHVVELVVNLSRSPEPAPISLDPRTAGRHPGAVHLPGGDWLSAAVSIPAPHQDTAVRQLPDVLAPAATHIDRWFWLRYHTPALGDHLRIRIHGRPDALTTRVLPLLTNWCTALSGQRLAGGMLLEPYVPETARYGGPEAIESAEEVFAADSAFTARCLALPGTRDDRLAVAAVSAVDIARTVAARPHEALRGQRLAPPDRRVRDALRPQVRAADEPAALLPEPLDSAWQARHTALAAYQATLPSPRVSDLCASDLVHMHCNRLLGTDPAAESIARSLATDLLHAHADRH